MQLSFYFCWRSAKSRHILTDEPFRRSKASLTIFIPNENNIFWCLGKLLSALCSLRGEKQTRGSNSTDLTTIFHSVTVPLLFLKQCSFSCNMLLLSTSSKHSVSKCSAAVFCHSAALQPSWGDNQTWAPKTSFLAFIQVNKFIWNSSCK